MLKIVHNMGQLPFSDLMRVYAEENLALGRRRWPREPQPRQLALAEEDFRECLLQTRSLSIHIHMLFVRPLQAYSRLRTQAYFH